MLWMADEAYLDLVALLVEGERAREDKISVRLILMTFQDADRPSGNFSPDDHAAREELSCLLGESSLAGHFKD